MNPILIDDEKCIACSSCINDCPNSFIYLEDGKIQTHDKGCMECGHCYAICPEGAIKMVNYDFSDEMVVSMSEINEDTLLNAMKSRRTIRQFKSNAPTGANSQDVKYTILGSKQSEAEEICVNLFRKGKKVGNLSSYLRRIEVTDDFFFKGAPLVIVVSSKSNINAGLASAYMEIMANSLGLGVLYSGFFVMCTKLSRKLRNLIELEKGYDVVSCMVIGYPKVKYQRIVPRKDLQVNRL